MIDYIKLALSSLQFAHSLLANQLLSSNWTTITNNQTGSEIKVATYKGLKFKIYASGRVEIDGSLHKYFNGGEHNYNDFCYRNLLESLTSLKNEFGEDLLNCRVENLEFGLNIILPNDADAFLRRIIVYLNKGARMVEPITKDDCKGFSKGVRFTLSEKVIKIYNKGKQYAQGDHLLRCEFKTVKMRSVEHVGIETLLDLVDQTKLKMLYECLMGTLLDIVIREDFDIESLNKAESRILNDCTNPFSWIEMDKQKRGDRKVQYVSLVKRKSISRNKEIVEGLLARKFSELIAFNSKTNDLLTGLIKEDVVMKIPVTYHLPILNLHYLPTGVQDGKRLLAHR